MSNYLSAGQVNQYQRDGILFPVRVLLPEEVNKFRAAFEEMETRFGGKLRYAGWLHLHFRWAYDLATHPVIVDAVESLLGADVVILSTLLLCKYPRDPDYASWHQDGTYSGTYQTPTASAWIALSDSNAENGCMRVLPGSHQQGMLPHVHTYAEHNILKRGPEIQVKVDESQTKDVCLKMGEMSLHHNNIVHGSDINRSETKRIGFIVRFVTPRFNRASAPAIQVRGQDDYHHFAYLKEPPQDDMDRGIANWTAFNREHEKA